MRIWSERERERELLVGQVLNALALVFVTDVDEMLYQALNINQSTNIKLLSN